MDQSDSEVKINVNRCQIEISANFGCNAPLLSNTRRIMDREDAETCSGRFSCRAPIM